MPVGRPMPPLKLSEEELRQLQNIANSRSMPHSIVQRAQIVLASGAGESNTAIAKRMGLTGMTVGKWRKRYREFGIAGLHDELRPGRPRTYEDDKVAEVINRALQTKPSDGSTHWSARSLAAETGISKSTVHRWLKIFALQPHRQMSGDNEVGRSATSSLAGGVSVGDPGAEAQGPGDAGTTDEPPTQPVHGETTRWQQPGGCCRSGGHLSAQCPPD